MNPISGSFRLLKKRCCCGGNRDSDDVVVEGRDPCRCYLAGLEAILDLPHVRILHCSLVNDVFNCPFFVAIDDDAKALVVSVRGTMSFMDAITGEIWMFLSFQIHSMLYRFLDCCTFG